MQSETRTARVTEDGATTSRKSIQIEIDPEARLICGLLKALLRETSIHQTISVSPLPSNTSGVGGPV